jgi:hypothetical protein
VEEVDPIDVANLRKNFLEDNLEGNTRCLRVELEVLVLSPSQYSTSVETHSLIAWQTSLIVGRSEISRQVLRRIVSCSRNVDIKRAKREGRIFIEHCMLRNA